MTNSDHYNTVNPLLQFDEASLTPRKREILIWLEQNKVSLRVLDCNAPQSMATLRVYIPQKLSRAAQSNDQVPNAGIFTILHELFNGQFTLDYVDSYPWEEDKYRFLPISFSQ